MLDVCLFVLLPMTYDHVPSWERSHTAVRELCRLIPNFQKKIDEGTPEELSEFYAEVSNILVDTVAFTH